MCVVDFTWNFAFICRQRCNLISKHHKFWKERDEWRKRRWKERRENWTFVVLPFIVHWRLELINYLHLLGLSLTSRFRQIPSTRKIIRPTNVEYTIPNTKQQFLESREYQHLQKKKIITVFMRIWFHGIFSIMFVFHLSLLKNFRAKTVSIILFSIRRNICILLTKSNWRELACLNT